MEKFYEHLEQVLDEIDFRDRTSSGHLMSRLRRALQSHGARPERSQHPARHPDVGAGQAAACEAIRSRATGGAAHDAP
jgi:hypothetical protein